MTMAEQVAALLTTKGHITASDWPTCNTLATQQLSDRFSGCCDRIFETILVYISAGVIANLTQILITDDAVVNATSSSSLSHASAVYAGPCSASGHRDQLLTSRMFA